MTTKYVCMAPGCTFVSEDPQEAMDHMGSHPDIPDVQIAELSETNEGIIDCDTFVTKSPQPGEEEELEAMSDIEEEEDFDEEFPEEKEEEEAPGEERRSHP